MEIIRFLQTLRLRWRALVASVILLAITTIAADQLIPANFKSVASIVVDPRNINPLSGASTQDAMAQQNVVGTYLSITRSEGVARAVVKTLGLDSNARSVALWKKSTNGGGTVDFVTWTARDLLRRLDARIGSQNSNIIDISYTAADREDSARIANAFARATIDYARTMRISPARDNAIFFEAEAARLRKQMEESEMSRAKFQLAHGLTGLDQQGDVETAKLAALTNQLVANQALGYDSRSRAYNSEGGIASPDVLNDHRVQVLLDQSAQQEAKLQEMSARLVDNHPDLLMVRKLLAETQAAIQRESRRVAASLEISNSINNRRIASSRSDTEQQKRKVLEEGSLRAQLSALDRDAKEKRRMYELTVQRATESALIAGNQASDLRILSDAAPPDRRSRPMLTITLPLSIMLGLMLGAVYALLRERMAPQIIVSGDLEALGIKVLAAVPRQRVARPARLLTITPNAQP